MLDRSTRYTATSINTAKYISTAKLLVDTAAQTPITDSTAKYTKYSLSESHITKANTTSAFLLYNLWSTAF